MWTGGLSEESDCEPAWYCGDGGCDNEWPWGLSGGRECECERVWCQRDIVVMAGAVMGLMLGVLSHRISWDCESGERTQSAFLRKRFCVRERVDIRSIVNLPLQPVLSKPQSTHNSPQGFIVNLTATSTSIRSAANRSFCLTGVASPANDLAATRTFVESKPCEDSELSQKFSFEKNGDGSYVIRSQNGDHTCLTAWRGWCMLGVPWASHVYPRVWCGEFTKSLRWSERGDVDWFHRILNRFQVIESKLKLNEIWISCWKHLSKESHMC